MDDQGKQRQTEEDKNKDKERKTKTQIQTKTETKTETKTKTVDTNGKNAGADEKGEDVAHFSFPISADLFFNINQVKRHPVNGREVEM